MGSWVNGNFGYGIQIPPEDYPVGPPSAWLIDNGFVSDYDPESDYHTIDWYEALEAVTDLDHNLSYDIGYVHDYYGGAAVFYGDVLHTDQTVKAFKTRVPEGNSYANAALSKVAEMLGVPFQPHYILVVSYG